MFRLADAAQRKATTLALVMPRFDFVFDGWTNNFIHFIGLFITLPAKDATASSLDIHLLAFAPLLDETYITEVIHRDFFLETLDWYDLSVDNQFCLIGDNCNASAATADLLRVPLQGCRSHRLNLAVDDYIEKYLNEEVDLVRNFMSKLTTLKEAGRRRFTTSLRPAKRY